MRIVVAGAGDFGLSVAQLLTAENFDVVLVDNNPERVKAVQGAVDCMVLEGNPCTKTLFARSDVAEGDMFIACLPQDEMNMVSCMLAKHYGIPKTVACVREADYMRYEKDFVHEEMKIDLLLNTDYILAKEISKILTASSSLEVENFAGGKVKMFEGRIGEDTPFVNKTLKELALPKDILVALILHDKDVVIPSGETVLSLGDYVYFVGMADSITEFEKNFSTVYTKPQKVLLIGAGRTGRFTAPLLERRGLQVKAIEKNRERCQLLAAELKSGMVLCGDGTNVDLLTEEGVAEADVVVCITDDDKLNLMVALLAKHLGAKRTLVRVDNSDFVDLMGKVGVDEVLSTRSLMAERLLRFVHGADLLHVSVLDDAQAEALELAVGVGSVADGKMVKDLGIPVDALLCAVVRGNDVYIPKGSTVLNADDRLVVLTKNGDVTAIANIFESRN